MRVFSLSYVPQAVCLFCVYFLQSMVHHKMATLISLLRGIVLNGTFLMLFPLIWGGNGIWWAIFAAELVTMFISACYLLTLYRRQTHGKI